MASKTGRPSIDRNSIAGSESNRTIGTTPSGSSNVKIELTEFNNLVSQLHQWLFINLKLEQSFKEQQQKALDEIYDRWIQIFKLIEESYSMSRSIFILNQIVVLNKSLVMQNDFYTDISLLFDQFNNNCQLLMKKVCLYQFYGILDQRYNEYYDNRE